MFVKIVIKVVLKGNAQSEMIQQNVLNAQQFILILIIVVS